MTRNKGSRFEVGNFVSLMSRFADFHSAGEENKGSTT